jgi:hypothetical protein
VRPHPSRQIKDFPPKGASDLVAENLLKKSDLVGFGDSESPIALFDLRLVANIMVLGGRITLGRVTVFAHTSCHPTPARVD